ncbi:MAG: response regulator [Rhodoferax sp.]|nr:response regulator [Rhodoferax sp.]
MALISFRTMTDSKTLLIVDDSRVSRMMIRGLVATRRPEWVIIEAASGDEALRTVGLQAVDYCTMDINMPGLPGTEAAEQIRQSHPAMRLALFSANIQESQKARASQMGVKFVAKPVNEKSVLEAVAFFEAELP